ncbi:hypothetical protein G6F47_010045 [Rhizopus delemar]|nr:hypothetical protein G6F54_010240 [Rhizopus delemar]KAG1509327.1 hypothetical protein G6F53_007530 [Rhizopus delemar]KAG1590461.1 hypothetical protein G6F47_010045 [Rhizopus delemar]KAG1639586.1 hypothetical protein G6F44_007683 [Rhizopus delemar]
MVHKENARLVWDNMSLTTSSKSPDNVSIRPDMIFSTKLACGTELEIANGEIKRPRVSKCEVVKARLKVLETAKRQLHHRLKITSAAHKHITFGVLIYGKMCCTQHTMAGEDTTPVDVTDMHLLPIVTYCEVYKES